MQKIHVFFAIAISAPVAIWISRCGWEEKVKTPQPLSTPGNQTTLAIPVRSTARPTPISPETDSPATTSPTQPDDPKLTAAKKHLPWASDENLKMLVTGGVNIENIERGRSQIANDLIQLKVAVSQYHKMNGEYPSGDNVEVAKALMGQNTKKIVFVDWPKKQLGQSGELLDPWGTVYHVSVTIDGKLDIRSAGKDRVFWNADDEVFKSAGSP